MINCSRDVKEEEGREEEEWRDLSAILKKKNKGGNGEERDMRAHESYPSDPIPFSRFPNLNVALIRRKSSAALGKSESSLASAEVSRVEISHADSQIRVGGTSRIRTSCELIL